MRVVKLSFSGSFYLYELTTQRTKETTVQPTEISQINIFSYNLTNVLKKDILLWHNSSFNTAAMGQSAIYLLI